MCIVHVLHKHIQCFCPAGGTVYAAQQLSNLCLSNRLEDFEDNRKVGFLDQSGLPKPIAVVAFVILSQRVWRDIRWPCVTAVQWGACGVSMAS